jgi:hypothetical membrane protein
MDQPTTLRRPVSIGGVVGPLSFIGAWAGLGAIETGYSSIHDSISRLAAVDASTRWAMTLGLLSLGAGVGLFARDLRRAFPAAATAAAVTACSSLAIAATPLGSVVGGVPHAAAAGLAYGSLAAVPGLAGFQLWREGEQRLGRFSMVIGAASAASLTVSIVSDQTGLWQRLGLTLAHTWIIATALHRPRWGLRSQG